MSDFLEYPDDELNDAKTSNVILFSIIVVATILLLSFLLTILGCFLLGFRRNSYTVSRARRRLKQEIKRFNLKSSTVLAKNQKSLRYLASHPRYEDKFAMLGYIPAEIKKMEAESEPFEETELMEGLEDSEKVTEGLEDGEKVLESLEDRREAIESMEEKVTKNSSQEEGLEDTKMLTEGLDEFGSERPPEYKFPKYLIASAQEHPEQPPPYVFPRLISITKKM